MIGLLGGLAGVLISHVFAAFLSTRAGETVFLGMYFQAGMKMVLPVWLDLASLGVAVLVGGIAGIVPADRAAKMSPLQAIQG